MQEKIRLFGIDHIEQLEGLIALIRVGAECEHKRLWVRWRRLEMAQVRMNGLPDSASTMRYVHDFPWANCANEIVAGVVGIPRQSRGWSPDNLARITVDSVIYPRSNSFFSFQPNQHGIIGRIKCRRTDSGRGRRAS